MGCPKALLRCADGVPLAARQAEILRAGGCAPVAVVLGAEIDASGANCAGIGHGRKPALGAGPSRLAAAGIAAFPEATAICSCPSMRSGSNPDHPGSASGRGGEAAAIWRPTHRGEKGNLLRVPRAPPRNCCAAGGCAHRRVGSARARTVAVDDPAILATSIRPKTGRVLALALRA
jgi:hypothetical protein